MPFRRQDLPKTTRQGKDGQRRRLYPRFAKDRTLLPKLDLAIDYLDGMTGRRRGDLSEATILDLFGDPKMARCLLVCLAESYRYRTLDVPDVIGETAVAALAGWELLTPADLRAHVYRAVNARHGGFVSDGDRDRALTEIAAPLGLSPVQLDELLSLDAERNARLVRIGPRPRAEDVLARYNVILALSTLRHASEIELTLPGLDHQTIATIADQHEVPWRGVSDATIRLAGRRDAMGTGSAFGARVARCALHLIIRCPRPPGGQATIHLNEQRLSFVLDRFVIETLRPPLRLAATPAGIGQCTALMEAVTTRRRHTDGGDGWTRRRAMEPVVGDGVLVLPEVVFARETSAVAIVPVAPDEDESAALAAIRAVQAIRPTLALGVESAPGVPGLVTEDATEFLARLNELAGDDATPATPVGIVRDEVVNHGWVDTERLISVLGDDEHLAARLQPLTADGEMTFVPGFGLCYRLLLDALRDQLAAGPRAIDPLRAIVAARVGDGPGADVLTLALLQRHTVIAPPPWTESAGRQAA